MRRKIIISIINLILTLFCFVSLTFSWFAFNDNVNANGMTISVKDEKQLVIAKGVSELEKMSSDNKQFSLNFNDCYSDMIACTHDNNSSTLLKYVKNTYDLDKFTGLPITGKTIEFSDAPTDSKYFFDITVYIASTSDEIKNQNLIASITNGNVNNSTLKAASIDFYLNEVNANNYKGTLNAAMLDANVNDYTTLKSNLLITNSDIPLNTTGYIKVIMRYYFDGALLESENSTFVKTYNISTDEIDLRVNFEAVDANE